MSDHCPLLLQDSQDTINVIKPFRFLSMWTTHPSFYDFLTDSWTQPCSIKGLTVISIKIKRLKIALKAWNWNVFGDIFLKLNPKREDIQSLEEKIVALDIIEKTKKEYQQIILQE